MPHTIRKKAPYPVRVMHKTNMTQVAAKTGNPRYGFANTQLKSLGKDSDLIQRELAKGTGPLLGEAFRFHAIREKFFPVQLLFYAIGDAGADRVLVSLVVDARSNTDRGSLGLVLALCHGLFGFGLGNVAFDPWLLAAVAANQKN